VQSDPSLDEVLVNVSAYGGRCGELQQQEATDTAVAALGQVIQHPVTTSYNIN
jgi:hypothetical protein